MLVIGIHNTGVQSSAAFVKNGELIFGAMEERYSRNKFDKYFPSRVIDVGLKMMGATFEDVDSFCIGWNPALNISERFRAGFSEWPGFPGARFYTNPNSILPRFADRNFIVTEQSFVRDAGKAVKIQYLNHHLAHAFGALVSSGFENSAILICDGYSERSTTSFFVAENNKISMLADIKFPHSIGQFYSMFTQFLGFRPDQDEWKVMGAAAYGDSTRYYKLVRSLIHWSSPEKFELNLRFFNHFNFDSAVTFSDYFLNEFGSPRSPDGLLEQRHFDIAAALQIVLEEYLFEAIDWIFDRVGGDSLCLSGGVFMNSLVNGKLSMRYPSKNIHIPFSPDDSGNAIGAAAWSAANAGETLVSSTFNNPYLGQDYSEAEILEQIRKSKCTAVRPEMLFQRVAKEISLGRIVGWYRGKMEFGQRALGNRSILADPRNENIKDLINSAVKFRESFRPFAPSILEEYEAEWFEVENFIPVRFMEKVLPFRQHKRELVPAAVHADGTGRVQTVSRHASPDFYQLINTFFKLTGVPMLINTSFNIAGEPIVESPADAIKTFYSSGLDVLVLGPFLLNK